MPLNGSCPNTFLQCAPTTCRIYTPLQLQSTSTRTCSIKAELEEPSRLCGQTASGGCLERPESSCTMPTSSYRTSIYISPSPSLSNSPHIYFWSAKTPSTVTNSPTNNLNQGCHPQKFTRLAPSPLPDKGARDCCRRRPPPASPLA